MKAKKCDMKHEMMENKELKKAGKAIKKMKAKQPKKK